MFGAIIGDIVGSRFELHNIHTKDFEFFHTDCRITDKSAMTIAVMETILKSDLDDEPVFKRDLIQNFKRFYTLYPDGGSGHGFLKWPESDDPQPYNSFGSGVCICVSPCGVLGSRCEKVTRWTTEVSHNHPYALRWAAFLTDSIDHIWHKCRQEDDAKAFLRFALERTQSPEQRAFYYPGAIGDAVRPGVFDAACQEVMPLAVQAVLDAEDFEDAIRNAVLYGRDSDTIAAIAGSLAEVVFGISVSTLRKVSGYIPIEMISTVRKFDRTYRIGVRQTDSI